MAIIIIVKGMIGLRYRQSVNTFGCRTMSVIIVINRGTTMKYLNAKQIRLLAKEHNKRVGKAFLEELNRHVERKVIKACDTWNGSKKTLDQAVASIVLK